MARLLPSRFSSYDLSEEEIRSGKLLTDLQKMVIQNLLNIEINKRLNIQVDPLNLGKFYQEEAELKGTIMTYQFLLDSSEEAEQEIARLSSQSRSSNT